MNDIRRTILWVVFGFSMVLLWDKWQIHNGHKATFFPERNSENILKDQKPEEHSSKAGSASVNESNAIVLKDETSNIKKERLEFSTDVLKIVIDTSGAKIVKADLLKHKDEHHPEQPVVLLNDGKEFEYSAQSGIANTQNGCLQAELNRPMQWVKGENSLKDDQNELILKFQSAEEKGIQYTKTYHLRRSRYDIEVEQEILNQGPASVPSRACFEILRNGAKLDGESSMYSTYTGPAVYTETQKFQKVEFSDIDKDKAEFEKRTLGGYVAMIQHYFATAWVVKPAADKETEPSEVFAKKIDHQYLIGMMSPTANISSGSSQTYQATLYVGPQEEKNLNLIYDGLEKVKDYGKVTVLAVPLYWLLDHLNTIIGNWGWSIVALVILLKIAFFWLNAKAYKSMAKMKAINPKIMEMRARLKDNPQQMQAEMMKIYREEKVNPMGGCLPIVIQIPVFIALYWVLLSSVEMRNAPWVGWIHDLSSKDPFYVLPVLMTLSSLFQTWLNPTPPDPIQAKMMWIMPLAFSVMFFYFPAGLVLYWLTNNVLSIAQQWVINRSLGVLNK